MAQRAFENCLAEQFPQYLRKKVMNESIDLCNSLQRLDLQNFDRTIRFATVL